ncbi:MAG: lycopene cyclase domain-containing protein [Patescibacteria group bacterium]
MFDYQYAYLVGNLFILFPIWLAFFLHRRDLRTEILKMSLILGLCGPISQMWYLQDYWSPQTFTGTRIGIEDFLFGFFIGGIVSVVYLEMFNKHLSRPKNRHHHWRLLFVFIAIFLFFFNILFYFGVNSIYASIAAFLSLAVFIYYFRQDLFIDGLASGIFLAIIMFLAYLAFLFVFPETISRWWFLHNISGILILGIPMEELLWAFSLGLVAGPTYEFLTGIKILKNRKIV